MNVRKILEKFLIMANIPQNEAKQWIPLCTQAFKEIQSSLKECVDESAHEDRLNSAAAVLAIYKYTLHRFSRIATTRVTTSQVDTQATTPIDVQIPINRSSALNAATLAWQETRASLSDILKDPDFTFKSVR